MRRPRARLLCLVHEVDAGPGGQGGEGVTTLSDLVEEVVGELNQFTTNQERTGTFVDWVLDGALAKVGVTLSDISSNLTDRKSVV